MSAADNEGFAAYLEANNVDTEDLSAVNTAVGSYYDETATTLEAQDAISAGFADRSSSFQDAAIAEAVSDAEAELDTAEQAVEEGVLSALDVMETRQSTYADTVVSTAAAEAAYDRQVTIFEALNSDGTVEIDSTSLTFLPSGGTAGTDEITLATRANGEWVLEDGINEETYDGLSDLVDTADQFSDAEAVQENALTALQESVADVVRLETDAADDFAWSDVTNEATIDATTGEVEFKNAASDVQTVLTEREDLSELQVAIDEFENARALNSELEGLEQDRQDAEDYLSDSEEDGGLDVNLITDYSNATGEDDVYLFSDDAGAQYSISSFGEEGQDRMYFGDDFQLVALGEDEITDRVGSADSKEIFWEQNGSDLTLFVEAEAEAGRDIGGVATDNMTEITLTGVSIDDVNYSGGFLTADTVEVA